MFNIYNITAVFLFIFSLLTFSLEAKSKQVKQYLLFSTIWLIIYEGFRWQIGTDWDPYYSLFVTGDESSHFEVGYMYLMRIIHLASDSYIVFLVVITSFFYLTLRSFLHKYAVNPLISLTIYYCLMVGLMGSNRQIIALFICLISLKYCFKKNITKFLCCIALAFVFHTTSIIFMVAYFVINCKLTNKFLVYGIIISLLLGLSGMVNRIPYVDLIAYLDSKNAEKLSTYANSDISAYSYLGTIKRLIILAPCFLWRNKIKEEYHDSYFKLYVLGCIIYFSFNGSLLQLMAGRGALYFNIFEMLLIPIMIRMYFKGTGQQKFIWFLYFTFLLYIMNRDMDSYVSDGIDIFRPYKSVLF